MDFKIEGEGLEASVVEEATYVSRHTGRTLKRITARLAVRGDEAHERILRLIRTAKERGADADDGYGTVHRWRVDNHSYSYASGDDPLVYDHVLEMEETEELMPTQIRISDLSVEPYTYEEEFDGDPLIITARVALSDADGRRLKELIAAREYYVVVREGVSEDVREMRFGRVLWSQRDETTKYLLTLVERSYDDEGPQRILGEPHVSNVERSLATGLGVLDALLDTLASKGLLTEKEQSDIRSKGDGEAFERRFAFSRVDDVDRW